MKNPTNNAPVRVQATRQRWLCSAAALTLVGATGMRVLISDAAPQPSKKPVTRMTKTNVVKTQDQGYRPSEFPGVMVRSMPSQGSSKSGTLANKSNAGWIRVKPGAALPPAPAPAGRTVARIERGTTALGGKKLYLHPSKMPYSSAARNAQGRVLLKCERNSQPHSAAEHARHAATDGAVKKSGH